MKARILALATACAIAAAAIAVPSAEAGGRGHRGHHHGHHHGHGEYLIAPLIGLFAFSLFAASVYDPPPVRGGFNCHRVTRLEFDSYGRGARVYATMCYTEYGDPYIVPGSRYYGR